MIVNENKKRGKKMSLEQYIIYFDTEEEDFISYLLEREV